MFYFCTLPTRSNCVDVTFVVLEQHVKEHSINEVILKFFPDAKINTVPEVLPGAVCTCLRGIENVNDNLPVIFNDCDHMFSCKTLAKRLSEVRSVDFDGALITFESSAPQFSYVKYDASGNIIGTIEKQVVSNRAICGAYFFANAELFRMMAKKYFETCQYKEYFVSGLYNELCKADKKVLAFKADFYLPFGTPTEYERAKSASCFFEFLKEK